MKLQHYLVSNNSVYHLAILNAIHCIRRNHSLSNVNNIAVWTRLGDVTTDQKVQAGKF